MKVGNFYLPQSFVIEQPDLALQVFSKCIILRCKYVAYTNEFSYTAICEEFDELEDGNPTPTYYLLRHDLSFVKE